MANLIGMPKGMMMNNETKIKPICLALAGKYIHLKRIGSYSQSR
ncbi:hypothetical protein [Shewanella halifaxensis]|nr:hypothetical protein [Shewanella halifaxensis]